MASQTYPCYIAKRLLSILLCISLLLSMLTLFATGVDNSKEASWLWPVPGSFKINSLDSYNTGGAHNEGQCLDIGANGYTDSERLDVLSATSGTVFYIRNVYDETTDRGSGWGNYVIIQTGDILIVYAHLQSVTCDYGTITAGDVIGKMGKTGNATGVHLHMQAYPADGSSSDTDIYVFDKFKDNPLYATRFEFWDGLQTNSTRYGAWIRTYFKTLKGVYYTYSGGMTTSFSTEPLLATVTVIATSGAPVYTTPVDLADYQTSTLPKGQVATVNGIYYDAAGEGWLRILGENTVTWIRQSDVGFYDYSYHTVIENEDSPSGSYGAYIDLNFAGKLVSDNAIASITAEILSGTKVVSSYQRTVNASTFDYTDILAPGFSNHSLSDGSYTFRLSVTETAAYPGVDPASKTYVVTSSSFTIDSSLSDKIAPVIANFAIRSLNAESVTFFLTATDNNGISRVTASITGNSKTTSHSFAKDSNGYTLNLAPSALSGSGNYTITVTAYDTYGNTTTHKRTFVVPANGSGEVWKINDSATPYVRIRSTPAIASANTTSYRLYPGEEVTITAFVDDGSYLWGKCSLGWFATNYATYKSGHLYTVNFDMNGGTSTAIKTLNKPYNQAVTLPTTVPTRSGYQFVGWSTASDASTATYTAGSRYNANLSVTLFAVWKVNSYTVNGSIPMTVDGSDRLIVQTHSLTVEALLKGLDIDGTAVIKDASGNTVTGTTAYVGTGATIIITDSKNAQHTLTVVILGDVDGDGRITPTDVDMILRLSNGMEIPKTNDIRLIAGDMDGDGVLSSTDSFIANVRK